MAGEYAAAQAGNAEMLALLVRQNVALVQALSRRFSFCEDAFQQGCIGLVYAIRHYREDSGCQFSTYAVPVILGEMRRAFSHTLGWRTRARLRAAHAFAEDALRAGRPADIGEIARAAGMERAELAFLLEWERGAVYDETGCLFETTPDPRGETWLERFLLRDTLARMPGMEGWLLQQRYCAGRSQGELAHVLHASQSWVSRLERKARSHFIQAWLYG